MAKIANELRIGNWVQVNSPIMQVKEITDHTIGLYMPGSEADPFLYDIDEVFPIPLSPEILEKCGFKKHNNYYTKDEFYIFEAFNSGKCFSYSTDQYYVELTSLHQLQNLYYSLTGEELIFKP